MVAAVEFNAVWKKFVGGERHDSLRDLVPAAIQAITGRRPPADVLGQQEFWALQDVDFQVAPGEALGIIGPNGAGKSTTLKLLTRILRPTRGTTVVRGRVGALIEVAAGFHPDLTGRENVYLQGAVMGMKRVEVNARFDEIVEFAGVAAAIDTPIKRYSSGMNARLGFSVAAHLNPQVLIIDEVLSVGDMAFQEKCVNRMRGFKRDGVTIVFVSHNLQAVTELCDRTLYVKRQAMALGPTAEVIDRYVRDAFVSDAGTRTAELKIDKATLTTLSGAPVEGALDAGTEARLSVRFEAFQPLSDLAFNFRLIRSTDQLLAYDGNFDQSELGLEVTGAGFFTVAFNFVANLTRGQYYFDVLAKHTPTQAIIARLAPAAHLSIVEMRTWGGVANLMTQAVVSEGLGVTNGLASSTSA